MKKFLTIMASLVMVLVGGVALAACGAKPLYNISFGGNIEGEKYSVAATTWEKSEEKGFEAVYTLKGNVAYDKATADALGYSDGRCHFALIRFTSNELDRVAYNEADGTGFYAKITNFYGTENATETIKHGGFSSGNEETKKTTYFLYQGVDNTVRTLTIEISFDGTEKNARLYKFVIDPVNYTLLNAE